MPLSYKERMGVMRLESRRPEVQNAVRKRVRARLLRDAAHLQAAARRRAPVDVGTLKASIVIDDSGLRRGNPEVRVGSALDYAIFQHEGTGIYYRGPNGELGRQTPWVFPFTPHGTGGTAARVSGGPVQFRWTQGNKPTKFLETPFRRFAPRYRRNITRAIQRGLDEGEGRT